MVEKLPLQTLEGALSLLCFVSFPLTILILINLESLYSLPRGSIYMYL